jgi:hypothetical protein
MIKLPPKSIKWKKAFENPRKLLDATRYFTAPVPMTVQGSDCSNPIGFGPDKYYGYTNLMCYEFILKHPTVEITASKGSTSEGEGS